MTGTDDFEELAPLLDAFLEEEPAPGIVCGVVRDGELVYARGIGTVRMGAATPPEADTVFRIASMTKSFTAAMVLLLRDEGSLALDEPVSTYVPELTDVQTGFAGAPAITVRHLLTMSAGLPYDDPWGDRQQDLELGRFAELLQGGLSFAWMPGTRFEYSNLGYGVLGRVVTSVTGREYRDVVRSRLLEPSGMASSGFDVDDLPAERLATGYRRRDDGFLEEPFASYGALASMGGLFSSVRDLSVWVNGFLGAWSSAKDQHPLSRASLLEMQQAHRAVPLELRWSSVRKAPTPFAVGYGFGLFAGSDLELGDVIEHSGGYPGFGSHMRWHPASGLGVIVLANRTYLPASELGERLLRALVRSSTARVRRVSTSTEVIAARDAVERLLVDGWDDGLAATTFSMNVDLDEPLERRRAEVDRLRAVHGRLRRSAEPPTSDGPMDLSWWMEGERGRVLVEIGLDPQPVPKVQWFDLTSVVEPDPRLRDVAANSVAALSADLLTPSLPLADGVDAEQAERDRLLVRSLFGSGRLGPPVTSDGSSATFRVTAERGTLDLLVALDPESGRVTKLEWTPVTGRAPVFDVR